MAWTRSRNLENFYHSLRLSVEAGIVLRRALELATVDASLRRPVAGLVAGIDRGDGLARAWRDTGFFGPLDAALVSAGEQSGQLAPVFRTLAEHYRRRHEQLVRSILGLVYPSVLVFLAIVAVQLPVMFTAGFNAFLRTVLTQAAAGGLVLAGAWWLWGVLLRSSTAWARLWYALPVVGWYFSARARLRCHELLAMTYRAGLPPRQFGELLAATAEDALFAAESVRLNAALQRDRPLSESLTGTRLLPANEAQMLAGAEVAGKLGEMAGQLADRAREEFDRAAKRLPVIITGILFCGVLFTIARIIVKHVTDYYKVVDKLL